MRHWIYEQMLKRQIAELPGSVCFMISGQDMSDAPEKLYLATSWCTEISAYISTHQRSDQPVIRGLTFHIATPSPQDMKKCLAEIRNIGTIAHLILHVGDTEEEIGEGMDVVVAIGKSGRGEISSCIRRMAEAHIAPEEVDEKLLESYLTFKYTPDVVIKSGGDHLTDFLIWQSVYSELFFSDVNWKHFRMVDFLRILRDYQSRMRRFGK
ncbi:MAG: undecaprenyl diphosphate synthase family protein [Methanomicrobiales archaeon]